jgi:dipeptidyl aminopeptidase/acylaminoacyl peptidase
MPLLLLLAAVTQAPSTDIYLADLRVRGGRVAVGTPVNVTARPGYDNQPLFLPDGRSFFYTSVGADAQADIYRYDLRRRATTRVTATPESEYSATPLPGGRGFSVVRVEADSTQRLWAFDLDGSHPRIVLQEIKPVGYHAWGDDHTLGLFVLGTPATLQLADTRSGSATVEARNIGRSIHKVPGRAAISFVQRDSAAAWWVKEVDLVTRQIRPLVRTRDNVDFYAWTPGGILLMAQGSKLYQWDPRRGGELELVADLATAGLANITRLAVSPRGDRLALVATDAPPLPPTPPPDL